MMNSESLIDHRSSSLSFRFSQTSDYAARRQRSVRRTGTPLLVVSKLETYSVLPADRIRFPHEIDHFLIYVLRMAQAKVMAVSQMAE